MLKMPWMQALAALLGCAGMALAEDWPAWRGPRGDGSSTDPAPPLRWSRTSNVRWKVRLPDAGNSSPVVWRGRVFLTQALDKGARRAVLCFDRADGKLLWQRETPYKDREPTHATNPYCSATPATDGERVVASLGSAGMVCYDFAGKELWRKDVGKLYHIWGNASSPVLYGDLAILWCGPGDRQFLLAVDKASGKTVWEHQEPGGKHGGSPAEWVGSWCTPLIARVGDHDELILGVPGKVKGFDPKTGKELWSCSGLGPLVYATPVCSTEGVPPPPAGGAARPAPPPPGGEARRGAAGGRTIQGPAAADRIVVALSGFHGAALAVRAGGKGDVTATHRLWHHAQRNPQRIGSPVIVGDHAYLLNEQGLAQGFDLKTGKDLWHKDRVSSPSWSSPVYAAGRLYVPNQAGDTLVLAASPKFEVLARNSLGERVLSSIALSDGQVFLRTYQHLWCIEEKK